MLNFFWYGGLSRRLEANEPADVLEARKTIEEHLTRVKAQNQPKDDFDADGTRLFNTIAEFVRRFMRSKKQKTSAEALDQMDRILDMAKPNLELTEEQAMAAIITYLRAKKVA